jgi:hypothetical protein
MEYVYISGKQIYDCICLDCAVARFEQWAGAGVVRRIAHPDPDAEPRVLLGSGFAGNQTNANATRTVAFLMQSTVLVAEM